MTDKYESGGFITKYGSSPYDMIECLHIRLALWNDYPSITASNFYDVFIKISSNVGKYRFWDGYRSEYGNDHPFKFDKNDCNDPMKFNVIFYIKENGTVAGYTQFLEAQETSEINELWIHTHFKYNTEVSDLVLKNSLESHIYENFLGNLDTKKPLDDTKFPTRRVVDSIYIDTRKRFTNLVDQLKSDDIYSLLNNNLVHSSKMTSKIKLQSPHVRYPNVSVGRFHEDLVLCTWDDYRYEVSSLIEPDKVYFSGNIRTVTTVGGFGLTDYSISRVSPYCVVCHVTVTPTQETAIICLEDNVVRAKATYEIYVNDHHSARSGCIVNNNPILESTLLGRIPSPELKMKVKSSVLGENFKGKFIGIDGSFCKFEYNGLYYYSNLEGTIVSENPNLMAINDTCLFEQTEDKIKFYFTYNGLETNEYKELIYEVERTDLRNPLLTSLRRNKINYDRVPDIVACYSGLMFYIENSKLIYM